MSMFFHCLVSKYFRLIETEWIIIMLKILKYWKAITYGNDLLRISVVVTSNTENLPHYYVLFPDTSSITNYYTQFIGIQYTVDGSIIRYATGQSLNLSSNVSVTILYSRIAKQFLTIEFP